MTFSNGKPTRIDAALDWLLADPTGRASLVEHLADFAVLATEPSMSDATRGRALRRHFEPEPTHDALERASDGSIVREGESGWNR